MLGIVSYEPQAVNASWGRHPPSGTLRTVSEVELLIGTASAEASLVRRCKREQRDLIERAEIVVVPAQR